MQIHPRPGKIGEPITINHPCQATPLYAWIDPAQVATVAPDGPLPAELNGVPLRPWKRPPTDRAEWELLAKEMPFDEPPFQNEGKPSAAGAVVVEPDGRVWITSPTNGYSGYKKTLPKGRCNGMSLKATALKEVYEETGLRVMLMGHLLDLTKETSRTRYYLARRIGGTPSAMGWEVQGVHLVPVELLKEHLNKPVDHAIAGRLLEVWGSWAGVFSKEHGSAPTGRRRRLSEAPEERQTPSEKSPAEKFGNADAEAIAQLANSALKSGQVQAALPHCKHLALALHYKGRVAQAEVVARFVKYLDKSTAPAPKTEAVDEPDLPAGPELVDEWMPTDAPIYKVQAEFMAQLILDLEAACVRAYNPRPLRQVRFSFDLTPQPWDLPEYSRFVQGALACGFVCEGWPPEDWLDLEDVNERPEESVQRMSPADLRLYIHSLHRDEKWKDCGASSVLEALASGALQAVARRLMDI